MDGQDLPRFNFRVLDGGWHTFYCKCLDSRYTEANEIFAQLIRLDRMQGCLESSREIDDPFQCRSEHQEPQQFRRNQRGRSKGGRGQLPPPPIFNPPHFFQLAFVQYILW